MKKLIINHSYSAAQLAYLETRGVAKQDMIGHKGKLDIGAAITSFQADTPGMRPVTVSAQRQRKVAETLLATGLGSGSYKCIGISSFPSDLIAKRMAIALFSNAIISHRKSSRSIMAAPLWHRVYSGFGDSLLSRSEKPSLLVITNVTVDSTNFKLEKVRDLLEMYRDVPRIVVTTGTDPVTFFRTKLYYPMDACLYLGAAGKVARDDM